MKVEEIFSILLAKNKLKFALFGNEFKKQPNIGWKITSYDSGFLYETSKIMSC